MRYYAFALSGALILIGIGIFVSRGMDNFGVDFQQGTNLMLRIENQDPVDVGGVREVLTAGGFNNPVVQEISSADGEVINMFNIRVGDVTREALKEPADTGSAAFRP